ncbi:HPP family protein [Rhodococcus jostii]|uniref:HPP family protein n=1 Tax=Rhodococcus jostii TaxID=132919 RepID=A0A1H4IUX5_RHOJO|nr:HPP family protein [Rhodococcus jostii]SEB37032.1 HPP family protein [Rhodococcus jostii]
MAEVRLAPGATGKRGPAAWALLRIPLVSGLGGFGAIFVLAQTEANLHTLLLVAPFGASCVLLFALPQSPLARPKNVIGGHLLSSLIGVAILAAIGPGPLTLGVGVGIAIAAMTLTDTVHPPAGADPILIIAAAASWSYLLAPILAGSVTLVVLAWCYHRFISKREYPTRG